MSWLGLCHNDEFTCKNEYTNGVGNTQCIPLDAVCDERAHCDDGSDETSCGTHSE